MSLLANIVSFSNLNILRPTSRISYRTNPIPNIQCSSCYLSYSHSSPPSHSSQSTPQSLVHSHLVRFILRPCQHDNGYIDGRSQIKVHTDERTQVHSAQSSLTITHPSTNRGRRYLISVNVPLSIGVVYQGIGGAKPSHE